MIVCCFSLTFKSLDYQKINITLDEVQVNVCSICYISASKEHMTYQGFVQTMAFGIAGGITVILPAILNCRKSWDALAIPIIFNGI